MTPEGWRRSTLGQHLREPVKNGYSPNCPALPTGKWIAHLGAVTENGFRPAAVKPAPPDDPKVDACRLVAGDLLVSRSNTRQRVGLAGIYRGEPAPCSYPDLLMRLRPSENVDPEFLLHTLLSGRGRDYFRKVARGTSGSMVKIDRALLESFPLLLPPLAEQRRIAAVLSAVDDAIEAAQCVAGQVIRLKRALLDRSFSKENANKEGWNATDLADLIRDDRPICYGILMPGRGHPGGIPVVKVRNIKNGAIEEGDLLLTSPEVDQQYARSRLRAGDLVLSIRGTTGRVARVPLSLDGANITQDSARLSIRPDVQADFIYHCLHSPYLQQQVADHTRGQAVKGINIADVRKLLVPVPPPPVQRELSAFFNGVDARLLAEQQSIAASVSLKAALQTRLLDGTLRVSLDKAA
jgi:type I restriction enzyme S subunit